MPVTGQPGLDFLVGNDLRILMATPGERHHEDPGLDDLAAVPIGDRGTLAEIDLRRFGDGEVQHDRRLRQRRGDAVKKAIDCVQTAAKAVLTLQCLPNGGHLHALRVPGKHLVAKRLDCRDVVHGCASSLERGSKLPVIGHRARRIEPSSLRGNTPDVGHRCAPDPLRAGDFAVRSTQAQAGNDLTNFVHLEPPVGHCVCSRQKARG